MSSQSYFHGTGRRKCAIAQVRLFTGKGGVVINGKTLEEQVPALVLRNRILVPLQVTGTLEKYNVVVKVEGGGVAGQEAEQEIPSAICSLGGKRREVL